MLKNKPARIALIATLASLLSYSIVQACSPVEPTILVKCSNLEVSLIADSSPIAGESYDDIQKRWADNITKKLQAVVPDCAEDLSPVLDSFEQEIIKWLDYKNKRNAFLDGDLILEPYSTNRDFELQYKKNSLLSCSYEDYKHIGNWLIIFETSRVYCHTSVMNSLGACPTIIFSLGHFLFYLVTNFSLTASPYLASLFLAGTIIFYIWWILLKNRPVLKLWKIIALSMVILAVELFLIVMPFWLPGQIIGWVLFFYILVLWYKHLKNKKLVSNQTAG